MTPAGGYVPFGRTAWYSYVFRVYASGYLDDNITTITSGVRPVINIKADVAVTGSGTKENPYQIS